MTLELYCSIRLLLASTIPPPFFLAVLRDLRDLRFLAEIEPGPPGSSLASTPFVKGTHVDHQLFRLKVCRLGSSLVVQWLGLCAFTATAWVQSLLRELRSASCCPCVTHVTFS